jgi:hypothetical protein
VAQAKKTDPAQVQQIAAAGEAVLEEVLAQSTRDVLMGATPKDLVRANPDAEVRKGTERPSTAWIHGPGNLEFLAVADKRFTRVAKWMNLSINKVSRIEATLVKGSKVLILKPAPETDRTAFEVTRYSGKAGGWVNLWQLLAEAGLTVDSAYKERYELNYIPQDSPLWPGLVIDLGLPPKERRQESVKKASE